MGNHPLILFSHAAAQGRRSASFLCTHLASHGYVVAALDHSEMIAPELARRDGETEQEKLRRWDAVIASRVPDIRFLLDQMTTKIDDERIGLVGHSFGGWAVLATADVEPRLRSIVALAPAGASRLRPGILPVTLTFAWQRKIPTLYLAAENDVSLPLSGMYEVFARAPEPKRMVILRRADHQHFLDNGEQIHETFRTMPLSGDLAAIQKEMLPISELHSGEQAHAFTRALTLAHMDATLKQNVEAQRWLAGDLATAFAAQGIEVDVHR